MADGSVKGGDRFGEDMSRRIALTRPGQVTLVRPDLGRTCDECRFMTDRRQNKGVFSGVCALVKLHTKKTGVRFTIKGAIACSQFQADVGFSQGNDT
jgi:hypothetical protein